MDNTNHKITSTSVDEQVREQDDYLSNKKPRHDELETNNIMYCCNVDGDNFLEWLPNSDHSSRELLFNSLATCQCCFRHQTDRPLNMQVGWKDTIFKNTNYYHLCECDCRHKMRFLARKYN
jgi:hypothetical protein